MLVIGIPLTVACSFEGVALVTILDFTPEGERWRTDETEMRQNMSERQQGGEKRRQRGRKVNKDNLIGDKNKAKGNQCITQSRDNTQ